MPGQTIRFAAVSGGRGSIAWSVNHIPGGNPSVGAIDANGNYTAPAVRTSMNVIVGAALAAAPDRDYATATLSVIVPGQVTPTANPQVASYSIYLPAPGSASIRFGTTVPGDLTTWSQQTPTAYGGMVQIYVAGMRADTEYHMHAQVKLQNGASLQDADHTFTSGARPSTAVVYPFTAPGQTPQSGIEMFDTLFPRKGSQAFATDLQGNVIWTYRYKSGSNVDTIQPIKLLPNGHFLLVISSSPSLPLSVTANPPAGTIDVVREIDLAGNTIRELTLAKLAQSLAAQGYAFDLRALHHDVLELPNGHLILLASLAKAFNNLPGHPGSTEVIGDLLVDVDENFKPTWVWNTFDHLDVNRQPFAFPDWTHGNALAYSRDDGNLLFSIRSQHWILKIAYQNGHGSGKILWRLGPGGDFKLVNGTDPTDWFYGQHNPTFFTSNTTGVFQLGVMDNGNARQFPAGVTCGSAGALPCLYSTAKVLKIDETAKTATIVLNYSPNPRVYSHFCGSVGLLADGHVEVDFCALDIGSMIQELDVSGGAPRVVWQATTTGSYQYRTERLPSLYPGVQDP